MTMLQSVEWQCDHRPVLMSSSVGQKIPINFSGSRLPVEWFLISNRTKPKMQLQQLEIEKRR